MSDLRLFSNNFIRMRQLLPFEVSTGKYCDLPCTDMVTLHMTTAKEPLTGTKPASFLKSVISKLKPQRDSEVPANKPSDKLADPARIGALSDEPEQRTSLNASASRCQFTFADERQCSNPAKVYQQDELSPVKDKRVSSVQLCAHHASKQKRGAKRLI